MAAETFDRSFRSPRPVGECWDTLTDVPRIAGWVSILGSVTEHEHLERYGAVLEDRMGPFTLRADLEITVPSVREPNEITVRADGEDRQVGSRITVDASLAIAGDAEGSTVTIAGRYEVTGRVATMGGSIIRQKADQLLTGFMRSAEVALS